MLARSGNQVVAGARSARFAESGIFVSEPPTRLGASVESSDTGGLLFLSGMLPAVNRRPLPFRFVLRSLATSIGILAPTDVTHRTGVDRRSRLSRWFQ